MPTEQTSKTDVKRERSTPNKSWDIKDVDFVYHNYGQMTVAEIAKDRELAPFQVNQIITGLRKRQILGKKRTDTHDDILNTFTTAISANVQKKKGKK